MPSTLGQKWELASVWTVRGRLTEKMVANKRNKNAGQPSIGSTSFISFAFEIVLSGWGAGAELMTQEGDAGQRWK